MLKIAPAASSQAPAATSYQAPYRTTLRHSHSRSLAARAGGSKTPSTPKPAKAPKPASTTRSTSPICGAPTLSIPDIFGNILPSIDLFDLAVDATKGDFTVRMKNEQKVVIYKEGTDQEITFTKNKDGDISGSDKKGNTYLSTKDGNTQLATINGVEYGKKDGKTVVAGTTIPTSLCDVVSNGAKPGTSANSAMRLTAAGLAVAITYAAAFV